LPLQLAASEAWADEEHVEIFRKMYKKNFKLAYDILGTDIPEATFYIWLAVKNEIEFTINLYKNYNVKVIPGSYLGREEAGQGYVRIALVENEEKTKIALNRIKQCLEEESK
jgi:aspartate/methionine/tyrosine aminotransferase